MNLHGRLARAISLLAASALTLVILIYPIALGRVGSMPSHGALALVMLGISAGFVHGVGFVPTSSLWRHVFHPAFAWPLMLAGMWMIFA